MRKAGKMIGIFMAALGYMNFGGEAAAAEDNIAVRVDGYELSFEENPVIADGYTMVPMRGIFEALDASVTWDEATKTVTSYKDGKKVEFIIGRNYLIKDGAKVNIPSAAMIINDRTYVPVRAVSESFDYCVNWNGDTRTVSITSDAYFNETYVSDNYTLANIPPYAGEPYTVINDNEPYFTDEDISLEDDYEYYGRLDTYGRCTQAFAKLSKSTMPSEERGSIGMIKPTGWHTVKYDFINGKYLYNRCHLIGYQLAGENANERNLITGTRYLNINGMLPYENETADYINETGGHVLYRVTPVYDGMNLVANGVFMEALSLEDGGEGVKFNVYCYNVQPGVHIDYRNGESCLEN